MITIWKEKWSRLQYQPCLPLGDNESRITGCQKHIDMSRKAAQEGTVLLKNDNGILPLKKGTKVALFGKAHIDYVRCGGGSANVYSKYTRDIYQGLKIKEDEGKVRVFDALSLYYQDMVQKAYLAGEENGYLTEVEIPDDLLKKAKEFTDTAIITVNRYSEEYFDRYDDGKDTYICLSDMEKKMVDTVCANFSKVIVLLNTGAMIDTSWFAENDKIQGALMIWQGGMEGGLATADILVGDVNPSGKLVDTCARNFSDYPSSVGFHESEDYVKYTEDVFVGYRYFETIPGKKDCVLYPFGFGLSYTTFSFSDVDARSIADKILVSVKVTNTGTFSGKEVVQVYYSAPAELITKPALELCAFKKTKLLRPGESETVTLTFEINDMASYDDMGAIRKSAYVLEKGEYKILIGNSVRNVQAAKWKYVLSDHVVTSQLTEYCAPRNLGKRLTASGEYIEVPDSEPKRKTFPNTYVCPENIPENEQDRKMLIDVVEGKITLDEFVSQLTAEEMIEILQGQPYTGVSCTSGMGNLPKYGVPNVQTTDGSSGVRIKRKTGVRCTAFPISTMYACTWEPSLMEDMGVAGALEVKENNMGIWLTPAMNIHRSPLCGRNFEYYSEDPLIAGKMAAANIRGIQSQGIIATPKHFACNNKETNRKESDSILSERALREIYIKAFEICVKESEPLMLMTAYNFINGVRASENAELIQGILRGEWGFKGTVISDWWNSASKTKEINNGNDIRMGYGATNDGPEGYARGELTRDQMAVSVKRLMQSIMWLE